MTEDMFPRAFPKGGVVLKRADYKPHYYEPLHRAMGNAKQNPFVQSCAKQLYERGFLSPKQIGSLNRINPQMGRYERKFHNLNLADGPDAHGIDPHEEGPNDDWESHHSFDYAGGE